MSVSRPAEQAGATLGEAIEKPVCGICGGLSWEKPLDAEALGRMLRTLVHRGPDDEGTHLSAPVALGARRLSIIDLQTGHQPIANEDESVWVVQNGEIYNYLELRQELEARGHRFRTKGDTEVLAHLYEERGEDFVAPLVGMFAIAVWDARAGKLVLARDRLGKKPLYYSVADSGAGDGFLFGSEIKALLASGRVSRETDWAALGEYFTKLYIGGEATVYRAVRQVRPGHLLVAARDGVRVRRYWDPWSVPRRAGPLREAELVEELGALLRQAVRLRLRSDVPLGCFLSGGLDSSLIAALACETGARLKTFTIGFTQSGYDESPAARELARHLGTEHREFRAEGGPGELLDHLPEVFDQPFGDSSAVPTWHVSRLTRQEVTVALSGDGGDEVFGGYRRYLARRWAERYNRLPRPLRRAAGSLAGWLGEPGDYYGGSIRKQLRMFTAYARQVEGVLAASRLDFFTAPMLNDLLQPEALERLRSARVPEDWPQAAGLDPVDAAMRRDLVDYLPDDIMVKVDRVSMDVSLEARAPLLDHRVVEFMLSLPVEWKLRGSTGKYLLRRFAEKILPAEVLRRPKHGFALSLHPWFRPGGGGRQVLEELSAAPALGSLARPAAVANLLERHAAGRADLSEHLWALVALGQWMGAGGRRT